MPEQFSITDADGERAYIADDVNGTGQGVVREIILHPGPAPQVQRAGQTAQYLDAATARAWGQGNRIQRFELIVLRVFESLGAAIEFKDTHEAGIPALGELTLTHSFGSLLVESTGYFEQVNVNPSESFGLRVQHHYHWVGTPFEQPVAE